MERHPLAGQTAPRALLVNIPRLVSAYYTGRPRWEEPSQRVTFGTSGHRGSAFANSFNEDHVLAVTQAVCDCRRERGVTGPLFLGMDTHALSEPSHATALEVLAANGVEVMIAQDFGYTPTPVISHAVVSFNRGRKTGLADGIVITPSHNPPEDGGFKYNPPEGGPADIETTRRLEGRANELLHDGLAAVRRLPYARALAAATTHRHDYVTPYAADLANIIDLDRIRGAGLRIGVDPLGGSTLAFWAPIAERYGLDMEVVNPVVDPTFSFMTVDGDGRIRMDCSSPYAMTGLIAMRDSYDIAFGNDPDGDRHGIVVPQAGLMNPNHYLAAAIAYLYRHRPDWRKETAVGKTAVSSGILDRVAADLGRNLYEVPVGFKWFVAGLLDGSLGFGGEESAGAAFLRKDGTVWATDKDGIIMDLLAAEMTAVTGKNPAQQFADLAGRFGMPSYERRDVPATADRRAVLKKLSAGEVSVKTLAGEPVIAVLTRAPGNGAPLDGIKVVTANGWFAARPSGTEDIYKIYGESFRGKEHLTQIQEEAQAVIDDVFRRAGIR